MPKTLHCPSTANAGIDKTTFTFGTELSRSHYNESNLKKLDLHIMDSVRENQRGYDEVIYINYQYAKCWIGIGCKIRTCKPFKAQVNLSKLSDNELMHFRKIIIQSVGKENLAELYNNGNITSMEFYIDQADVFTGDIIPVSKSGKWSIWGKDEKIETINSGNKLNKSYSKSDWITDKLLPSLPDCIANNFIKPVCEINRTEMTQTYQNTKDKERVRLCTMVENLYHPFQSATFIDMRVLDNNKHFDPFEAHYLRTKGKYCYLALAKETKPPQQLSHAVSLIESAERKGVDPDTDALLQDGIRRLTFFDPDFSVKLYKKTTPTLVLDYHHFGYITREVMEALNLTGYSQGTLAPECKKKLKAWYQTTNLQKLAGKALTRACAVELLTAQDKYNRAQEAKE